MSVTWFSQIRPWVTSKGGGNDFSSVISIKKWATTRKTGRGPTSKVMSISGRHAGKGATACEDTSTTSMTRQHSLSGRWVNISDQWPTYTTCPAPETLFLSLFYSEFCPRFINLPAFRPSSCFKRLFPHNLNFSQILCFAVGLVSDHEVEEDTQACPRTTHGGRTRFFGVTFPV